GVEARVAVGRDLFHDHGRLGKAHLQGLLAVAAAGQRLLLSVRLGRHYGLLGLTPRSRQFAFRRHDHLLRLLAGPGQFRLAPALGDLHLGLGIGQLHLYRVLCLRFVQRLQLLGSGPLPFERFQLLDGKLPQPQLFQKRLDPGVFLLGDWFADQPVDAFDVEAAEAVAQFRPGFRLNLVALVQQLQHRLLVGDVAKVRAEHRIDGLRDELLDVAESLDDARRPLVIDVNDHRERQERFVSIAGDEIDGTEPFVELVGLGSPRDPVENEVGGRHEDDLAGVDVEGVFAGAERAFPDTAFAFLHAFAVAEGGAGNVAAGPADVAHHHADVADRHHGLGDLFN